MMNLEAISCPLSKEDFDFFTKAAGALFSVIIATNPKNYDSVPTIPAYNKDYQCLRNVPAAPSGVLQWIMHVSDEASFSWSKTQCSSFVDAFNPDIWKCDVNGYPDCGLATGATASELNKYEASHELPLYYGSVERGNITCNCDLVETIKPTNTVYHQLITIENLDVDIVQCIPSSRRRSSSPNTQLIFQMTYAAYGQPPENILSIIGDLLTPMDNEVYTFYNPLTDSHYTFIIDSTSYGTHVVVTTDNNNNINLTTVTDSDNDDDDDDTLMIIGISIGCGVVLVLLISVTLWYYISKPSDSVAKMVARQLYS
jgi:hypothetical protein